MLASLDRYLNGMTMYRVVLYALLGLAAVAILLASAGLLDYNPLAMAASLLILLLATYGSNEAIGRVLKVPTNPESAPITAGILFFVFLAPASLSEAGMLALAGVVAMLSKYALAFRRQHVFNPAAVAAIAVGIPTGLAAWWVGTPVMLVPTLVAALLVVRKVRRFQVFLAVLVPGAVAATLVGMAYGQALPAALWQFFASWPALFFAGFMVTEPFTSPGTHRARLVFAAAVGVASAVPFHVMGPVYGTPELVLALGNAGAFLTGMRRRVVLRLAAREDLARDTYGFRFATDARPAFQPGQYLEWTLPHEQPDLRGIRRYFTIASSPAEDLAIGIRFTPNGSSFKRALMTLEPGAMLYASMRGGDFTLPAETGVKLGFIAGGIGITPFRSMVRDLLDRDEHRDIALFYASRTAADVAYRDLWTAAQGRFGMRTVLILSEDPDAPGAEHGLVTTELLARRLPNWQERTWYLSGPDAMVQAYKRLLRGAGIPRARIRTDYFPGF